MWSLVILLLTFIFKLIPHREARFTKKKEFYRRNTPLKDYLVQSKNDILNPWVHTSI